MYRETEYYQDRANRDRRFLELKQQGVSAKKRSCRNSVLSPSSIEDFRGTAYPNGFGGTAAQWFHALYMVEY
jgi:hypothetical protein